MIIKIIKNFYQTTEKFGKSSMITIVFDASTLIDLDIPQVNLLNDLVKLQGNKIAFIISQTNFEEIHSFRIRHSLESAKIEIKENDQKSFDKLSEELEKLRITLSPTDRHILMLAITERADFVVTSDLVVLDKITLYRKVKNIEYMKPITTVGIILMLFQNGKIDSLMLFEKSLNLFKFKEIDNILKHLSNEQFNVSRDRQLNKIDSYKEILRERFQIYKDPLLMEYEGLKSKGLIKI
jgi:rRNA-processing protein FCF1